MEDLEDLYLAEQAYARCRKGEEKTIPLEEAIKRHGITPEMLNEVDD